MDVSVDSITTSPLSLRLGGVVRFGEGGPVKFVVIEVPYRLFTYALFLEVQERFDRLSTPQPDSGLW